jgi:hypothetical protein
MAHGEHRPSEKSSEHEKNHLHEGDAQTADPFAAVRVEQL